MVVVPARHRVHDGIARLHQRAVGGVDHRPRAARDHDALQRHLDLQPLAPELAHGLPQAQDAVAGRVVRLARGQRAQRSVAEAVGNGELPRGEISDGEVGDLLPGGDGGADLRGDAEDLRSDQPLGHAGEAAARVRALEVELQLLHGAAHLPQICRYNRRGCGSKRWCGFCVPDLPDPPSCSSSGRRIGAAASIP